MANAITMSSINGVFARGNNLGAYRNIFYYYPPSGILHQMPNTNISFLLFEGASFTPGGNTANGSGAIGGHGAPAGDGGDGDDG